MKKPPICEYALQDLLPNSLTSSFCVNIKKNTEVWVATGMLVQYLESFTDSVVVRGDNNADDGSTPIGIVGGIDIIEGVFKNPASDFFDKTLVKDIMEKKYTIVTKQTKLKELLDYWKQTQRAFALIPNELQDYSAISAKKFLEIGTQIKTDMTISDIPKKRVATFEEGATVRDIISLMLENKTRRLLFKNSSKFINDRLILEKIVEELKYLRGVENFLDMNIDSFKLENARVVFEDFEIPEISKIMFEMEHPYVIFQERVITPWDICLILQSEELTEYGNNNKNN